MTEERSVTPMTDRPGQPKTDQPWAQRLLKAEAENHCGDLACQTRRVSAAVRVLTGWKEHQDYAWAVETFEVEIGVRDPATVGSEPDNIPSRAAIEAEARATAEAQVAELRAALKLLTDEVMAFKPGVRPDWRPLNAAYDKAMQLLDRDTPASSRFLDLDAPETVERLAAAIHGGKLVSGKHAGEPLCSMGHMPEPLCPAAPHTRHAEAILAALKDQP